MKNKIIFALLLIAVIIIFVQFVKSANAITPGGVRGWDDMGKCGNGKEVYDCRNCGNNQKREREPTPPQPTPSPPLKQTLPQADSRWTSVSGYSNSFNQCRNLCAAYQKNCGISAALAYCSAVVSVDLNKNGRIDANEIGTSPSGTKNCETNARCYDVIPECSCGNQQLDLGSCVNLFYQEYTNAGLSQTQALSNIAQTTSSNCQPAGT